VKGYAVLFDCEGDGTFCSGAGRLTPHTGSTYVGPIQTGEVMATDNDGVARVVYTAGPTSDSSLYRYVPSILMP
jgi:hypothetical protein